MSTIDKARAAKRDKHLDGLIRSDYGVTTNREYVRLSITAGAIPEEYQVEDDATRRNLEQEYTRMNQGFNVPWGNSQHPKTIQAQALKNRLAGPITSTEYSLLRKDKGIYSIITKTMFDFAVEQFAAQQLKETA